MAGVGQVLLHLEEAAREDEVVGVLVPVDDLLLQRRIDLLDVHRQRVGAKRAERREVRLVRLQPDLHALQVGHGLDRPHAVGDLARAELHEAERDEALVVHACFSISSPTGPSITL